MRETVGTISRQLMRTVEEVKADEKQLSRRLDKLATTQAAQATTLESLQLRLSTADAMAPASLNSRNHSVEAFHLLSIKDGVDVISSQLGQVSVSVGDTLYTLGKILKIEKRGRKWVLIAEQGKLTQISPRASIKSNPVGKAI